MSRLLAASGILLMAFVFNQHAYAGLTRRSMSSSEVCSRAIAELLGQSVTVAYSEKSKSYRVLKVDENLGVFSYSAAGETEILDEGCSVKGKTTANQFLVTSLQAVIDQQLKIADMPALNLPPGKKAKVKELPEYGKWVQKVNAIPKTCADVEDASFKEAVLKLRLPELAVEKAQADRPETQIAPGRGQSTD